jgi:biopolymer transport protein ExbD
MKLRGAKKIQYDSGPNMTPLVDVVMVILIFLMLVGQFGGIEHYLVSKLPYSEKGLGGVKPPSGAVPDEPLDIRVDSPSPDKWIAQVGSIRTSDAADLTRKLSQLRERYNGAGKPTDQLQVVISPGKMVKYDYLIGIYQAAMDAKFTKIAFAKSHP